MRPLPPRTTADLVLVCIDIQRDFIETVAVSDPYTETIANIRALVDAGQARDIPVIFIREVHHPTLIDLGREVDGLEDLHCIDGTPGAEYIDGLRPREIDFEVLKRRYSAFFRTDLDIILRGLSASTVILIGGLTDVCVHYTAVDAHQLDYHVRVVADAVYGSTPAAHEAALRAVAYLQSDAVISSSEAAGLLS